VNVFDFSQLLALSTERYLEFVRLPSFSVGFHVLEGGAMDHQNPHAEDEVYCVASGRAKINFESDGDAKGFDAYPGTIIFVPARVHHSPGTNMGPGTGTYLAIIVSALFVVGVLALVRLLWRGK
jgi:mannose-6-phosphate isomerase-like protein (cupin superfamily)